MLLKNTIYTLLLLSLTLSCSIGNIIDVVRFNKLEEVAEVHLIYNPRTDIDVAYDAEYFHNLRNNEAEYHKQELVEQGAGLNVKFTNNNDASYTLEVEEIKFEEDTDNECYVIEDDKPKKVNSSSNCFIVNDARLVLYATLTDNNTGKTKKLTPSTDEQTKVVVRSGSLREKEGNFSNIEEFLMNTLMYRAAGKTANQIKKIREEDT